MASVRFCCTVLVGIFCFALSAGAKQGSTDENPGPGKTLEENAADSFRYAATTTRPAKRQGKVDTRLAEKEKARAADAAFQPVAISAPRLFMSGSAGSPSAGFQPVTVTAPRLFMTGGSAAVAEPDSAAAESDPVFAGAPRMGMAGNAEGARRVARGVVVVEAPRLFMSGSRGQAEAQFRGITVTAPRLFMTGAGTP
jgi:hypothetical protein